MERNNYETFSSLLPSSRYQPCHQPDFPFACSGLWLIFRVTNSMHTDFFMMGICSCYVQIFIINGAAVFWLKP